MGVVIGEIVGDARDSRVNLTAAESLGVDDFAGCGFHKWRPTEEYGALVFDDDSFVTHCRYIGAASRA